MHRQRALNRAPAENTDYDAELRGHHTRIKNTVSTLISVLFQRKRPQKKSPGYRGSLHLFAINAKP